MPGKNIRHLLEHLNTDIMNTQEHRPAKQWGKSLIWALFGVTVGILIGKLIFQEPKDDIPVPPIVQPICFEAPNTTMEDTTNLKQQIARFANWASNPNDENITNQAFNVPARAVYSMVALLERLNSGGTPVAHGIRLYHSSTTTISPDQEPHFNNTHLVAWPLDANANILEGSQLPTRELPKFTLSRGYELPCPKYCD